MGGKFTPPLLGMFRVNLAACHNYCRPKCLFFSYFGPKRIKFANFTANRSPNYFAAGAPACTPFTDPMFEFLQIPEISLVPNLHCAPHMVLAPKLDTPHIELSLNICGHTLDQLRVLSHYELVLHPILTYFRSQSFSLCTHAFRAINGTNCA